MALCLIAWIAPASGQQAPAPAQAPAADQAPAKKAAAPARKAPRRPAPDHDHDHGPREFMGRPIADVMSYLGADWLFRPERIEEERPSEMLDALKITPGMTVADVGAGAGYHSLELSKRVGPRGVVYATDVQPQMIRMLQANARRAKAANLRAVLCTQDDPKLPPGAIDLVLMVDVYHEMSDPATSLAGLHKALKPGGRLVLVEFRAEDPEVPIKPEHKMTVAQVRKEVEPRGFRFQELLDFLPWQHVLIFEKVDEKTPAAEDGDGVGAEPAAEPTGSPPSR
jgi:ubiquinone/menaquinone biosynthesis C-methylase UbiE